MKVPFHYFRNGSSSSKKKKKEDPEGIQTLATTQQQQQQQQPFSSEEHSASSSSSNTDRRTSSSTKMQSTASLSSGHYHQHHYHHHHHFYCYHQRPFLSTLLWCFGSLLLLGTVVAVMGIRHVRYIQSGSNVMEVFKSGNGGGDDDDAWTSLSLLLNQPKSLPIPEEGEEEGEPLQLVSPPLLRENYRFDWSTEENYQISQEGAAATATLCDRSQFAQVRQVLLDHAYHKIYECSRQIFQDSIIQSKLTSTAAATQQPKASTCDAEATRETTTSSTTTIATSRGQNWIVFMAGVMGAGKSFTIRHLANKGRFPLQNFVVVDPDSVRRDLPEFDHYVKLVPDQAGERTRKESGMISELITEAALQRGQNVLVDGTLRNSTWYTSYFTSLRERYPRIQIGILHVTAPRQAVLERAHSRAKTTGRVVPQDLLEHTMLQVPRSIDILSHQADVTVQLHNAPGASDVEIVTPDNMTWESFTEMWKPPSLCAPMSSTKTTTTIRDAELVMAR